MFIRELETYYRVLDLEPGASPVEIEQAYKDLVFVWHPDRLPSGNDRLRRKAEAKLQALNDARDRLRTHSKKTVHKSASPSTARPSHTNYYYRHTPPRHYNASTARASRTYRQSTEPDRAQTSSRTNGGSHPSTAQTATQSKTQTQTATQTQTQTRTQTHTKFRREPSSPKKERSQSTWSCQNGYCGYRTSPKTAARPFQRDMRNASLQNANFREKDLSGHNLTSADLTGADLSDSFLHKVVLETANLSEANLFRANLLQANLRKANLQKANLIGADFSGADLSGADLRGAKIGVGDRVMVKLTGAILAGAILPDGRIHE
ncbi:MAG: pentapeptide repeat-containing protein [Cyanobacteria bacterium P01_H01_bin.15]